MFGVVTSISLTFVAVGSVMLGVAATRRTEQSRSDLLLTGNVTAIVGALGVLVGEFLAAESRTDVIAGTALGALCVAAVVVLIRWYRGRRARPQADDGSSQPLPDGKTSKRPSARRTPHTVSVPAPAPKAQGEWWGRNALGLLALAPVLVAALRVIFFSRGDPALLSVLGRSLDVAGVLLAGVVPFLGLAVSYALYVVIANRHLTPNAGRWLRDLPALPTTLVMVAVGVATLTTPARDAVFLLLLPALGIGYRLITGWVDRREGRYVPADIPAIVTVFVLVILQSAGPWLPEESVTFAGGSQETVYVLATEEGWTTLVDVDDREVSRVRDEQIVSREVCGSARARTLLHVISGAAAQPQCPDDQSDPEEAPASSATVGEG